MRTRITLEFENRVSSLATVLPVVVRPTEGERMRDVM